MWWKYRLKDDHSFNSRISVTNSSLVIVRGVRFGATAIWSSQTPPLLFKPPSSTTFLQQLHRNIHPLQNPTSTLFRTETLQKHFTKNFNNILPPPEQFVTILHKLHYTFLSQQQSTTTTLHHNNTPPQQHSTTTTLHHNTPPQQHSTTTLHHNNPLPQH